MSNKLSFTITLNMKGQNEIEKLFEEIGKKHDIDVGIDTSKVQAGIQKIQAPVKQLRDSLVHSFSQFGFAIQGLREAYELLSNAVGIFVNPAQKFEQLRIRLVNLYQDADKAAEVFNRFKEIAATTPYELANVMEAGVSLKAFGLNAEETLKSVTDLAAFMGVDVVEAAQAVGRAFAGGAGAADVLRERGILELIRSFNGIEDLTKLTLPEFRKVMIETMQDPTSGIAGATSALAKSYGGLVSNMQDAWTNFAASMGDKILPGLKESIKVVTKSLQELGESNSEAVKRTYEELDELNNRAVKLETLSSEYDKLKSKTQLNKEEHERLGQVIQEIAEIAPEAADEFDAYGNAISINTGKLETFIDRQRSALQLQFQDKIKDMADEYKEILERYSDYDAEWSKQRIKVYEKAQQFANQLAAIRRSYGSENIAPPNQQKILKAYQRSYLAAKQYAEELKEKSDNITKSTMPQLNNLIRTLVGVGIDFSAGPQEVAFQLGLNLQKDRALIDRMIARWKLLNSTSAETPDNDQKIETEKKKLAIAEKYRIALIEDDKQRIREKLAWELESEIEKAKKVGANEETIANIREYYRKKTAEEIKKYNQEEAEAEKNRKTKVRNSYKEELKLLQAKQELGLDVTKELENVQRDYLDFLIKEYGENSKEYLLALEDMEEATKKVWEKNHKFMSGIFDSIASTWRTAWDSLLDSAMTGSERIEAIWSTLKQAIWEVIGDITQEWITNKLKQMAISKTVASAERAEILKTKVTNEVAAASQKKSLLSVIALKIKSTLVTIGQAIAAGFKWLVSTLGPAGLGLGIALGGGLIGAFNNFRGILGFVSGGYTGDGNKNEAAGIVHKEELVFEKEITKPNLKDLLGLRSLLQKGYRLRDLMLPDVQFPSLQKPQLAYGFAGGGYAGNNDFSDKLDKILYFQSRIEKAIKNKKLDGLLELEDKRSGEERYRVHLKDKVKYERRNR